MGYSVQVVAPYDLEGEPVRSSRIRALLADEGAVDLVTQLLGRPYTLWGQVTSGAHRGRTLSFPTANLITSPGRLVPAFGIYACWAWSEDSGRPAAVSIGVRPTFDNGARTIEAYLLDYEGDLYGERMGLSFISRLRPELRFPDAAALIAQMRTDVAATRAILGNPPDHSGAFGSGWEELPHTADWAIRVQGESQRQLYARAAMAMYQLQDADPARPITLARTVAVEGSNPAELLVAWLNRLLFTQEVGGEDVHALRNSGNLGHRAPWGRVRLSRHPLAHGYQGCHFLRPHNREHGQRLERHGHLRCVTRRPASDGDRGLDRRMAAVVQ